MMNMFEPLQGIRVIDLTRYAPGPYCTMILGDLGAEIIRVDSMQKPSLTVEDFPSPSSPFNPLNRNKKSIAINLKTDQGRKIFYRLSASSDVVVESFRPGVTKRLGIDYEKVKNTNQRIVYCSITGYGQDGPYRDLPGHDINYISQGGVFGILPEPVVPGNLIGDMAAGGLMAVIGILSALVARSRTGKGQFVDISITDGVVSLLSLYLARYFETGEPLSAQKMESTGATPFYNLYKTKDGKFVSIACSEQKFFKALCRTLDCEAYIENRSSKQRWDEIRDYLARFFLSRTRDECFELLAREGVPVAKVYSVHELDSDPQLRHRNMFLEIEDRERGRIRMVGIPIKLSETPGSVKSLSPKIGEHTEEVLKAIGYKKAEIERLEREGVVFQERSGTKRKHKRGK